MRYALEMIEGRYVRMLAWADNGKLIDSVTIDAQREGALNMLISTIELHFAAVAKTHFDSTLRRMQREVRYMEGRRQRRERGE